MAALDPELLAAPVPGLDDWTLERVVRHLGRVHRWVTGLLAAPADADPAAVAGAAPSLPRGQACLDAYGEALAEMLAAFDRADPDRPVASFAGPADVRFWARRQAHEVAVHRIDAQDAVHAAGGSSPDPLDPASSADGVAEWLEVFAANHRLSDGSPLLGRSFGFVATDPTVDPAPTGWLLRYHADGTGASVVSGTGDSDGVDATLAGPAGTLLLALWRRRALGDVTVTGDSALAAALVDTIRI